MNKCAAPSNKAVIRDRNLSKFWAVLIVFGLFAAAPFQSWANTCATLVSVTSSDVSPADAGLTAMRAAGLDTVYYVTDFGGLNLQYLFQPTIEIPFGLREVFTIGSKKSAKTNFLSYFNYGISGVGRYYSSSSSGKSETTYTISRHTDTSLPLFFVYEPEIIAGLKWGLRASAAGSNPYVYSSDSADVMLSAFKEVSTREAARRIRTIGYSSMSRLDGSFGLQIPAVREYSQLELTKHLVSGDPSKRRAEDVYKVSTGPNFREVWIPVGKRELFIQQLKKAQKTIGFSDEIYAGVLNRVREISPLNILGSTDDGVIDIEGVIRSQQ